MHELTLKPVRVDWRFFNEAVETRAAYLNSLLVPEPDPPALPIVTTPPPPIFNRVIDPGAAYVSSRPFQKADPPPPPIVTTPPPPISNHVVEPGAAYVNGLPLQRLDPPLPPTDWLTRRLATAAVILAAGLAAALVLWSLRPALPPGLAAGPPPQADAVPLPDFPPAMAELPVPHPSTPQARIVTNFVRFTSVRVGDIEVTTGWRFASSEDAHPTEQWCDAFPPVGAGTDAGIFVRVANADMGVRPYNAASMAPLTEAEFRDGLSACRWAPGTVLQGAERRR